MPALRGAFTHESKVHLWLRGVKDLNHSDIFKHERVLHPEVAGRLIGENIDPAQFRKMKAAAERAATRSSR